MKFLFFLLFTLCSHCLEIRPTENGYQVRPAEESLPLLLRYRRKTPNARQFSEPRWLEETSSRIEFLQPLGDEEAVLEVLSFRYEFVSTLKNFGSGAGQVRDPTSISRDEFGHIYIVDRAQDSISKFSSSLNWLNTFGGFEWDRTDTADGDSFSNLTEARFDSPFDIACTGRLSCYVTDMRNHRVAELDLDGNFIRELRPRNAFDEPTSAAVTAENDLIVLDSRNDRIQVFNSLRRPLHYIGGYGTQSERLSRPLDFALVHHNQLVVIDSGNRQIKLFGTNGHFEASIPMPNPEVQRICSVESSGMLLLMERNSPPRTYSPNLKPLKNILPAELKAALDCVELPSGRLLILHSNPPGISTLNPVWSVSHHALEVSTGP